MAPQNLSQPPAGDQPKQEKKKPTGNRGVEQVSVTGNRRTHSSFTPEMVTKGSAQLDKSFTGSSWVTPGAYTWGVDSVAGGKPSAVAVKAVDAAPRRRQYYAPGEEPQEHDDRNVWNAILDAGKVHTHLNMRTSM